MTPKPVSSLKKLLCKGALAVAALLPGLRSDAQLLVTPNKTATELVSKLVGDNVAIFNSQLNCTGAHNGYFATGTAGTNLGLGEGIILATGTATTLAGPYNLGVGQTTATGGDPRLSALINNLTTNDACILEFDFVPDIDTVSTLRFEYVFGSEEYPGYTCSSFNDVFGFLISGPGYTNNTNIALVPGTNIPVAINSINSGVPSGGPSQLYLCTQMGPGSPFPQYFVNNNALNGQTISLDGFTTVLQAKATVTPCDTYHMVLGIANASDHALQSAVFLKANSFTVDTVKLRLDGLITSYAGYLVEGCTHADLVAKRTSPSVLKKRMCLEYEGTAINGIDYALLPDTMIIPSGADSSILTIAPLLDNMPEPGFETVKIIRVNCCTRSRIDSVEFQIKDSIEVKMLSVDTTVCQKEKIRLEATGDGQFAYDWTPHLNVVAPADSFTSANPDTTTTYTVTATYKTCPPVSRSFLATVEPIPIVELSPKDLTVCLEDSLYLFPYIHMKPDWYTDYTYTWSPAANLNDSTLLYTRFFSQEDKDYKYVLTVNTKVAKCIGKDSFVIHAHKPIVLDEVTADTMILYGNTLQLNASGADFYFWEPINNTLDNPTSPNPIARPLEPTIYTVYGVSLYGCRDTAYVKVDIDYTMNEYIPNAFTPNGDGRNDFFRVFNLTYQKEIEFRVFNRWGQEIFETKDPNRGWDGTYQGVPQKSDTYNYIIRIVRPDGSSKMYKGDIMLVR